MFDENSLPTRFPGFEILPETEERAAYANALLPDLPAYGGPRITDVLGACVSAIDPNLPCAKPEKQHEFGIDSAQQVVTILVDGLGWILLRDHFAHAPLLRSCRSTTTVVHTVAPSTTAAAITSFATGRLPGSTRMVGYSVLVESGLMNLLAFGPGVDPAKWQPCSTIFQEVRKRGIHSSAILPPTFAGSGLTRASLRGTQHVAAVSLDERIDATINQLRAGTSLVYLYWSEIDHVGHVYGVTSPEWARALEDFDAGLKCLLSRIPEGVRVVLTADHGMIDIARKDIIDLSERSDLNKGVRAIAGETRCIHLHCEPSCAKETVQRWRDILGETAWIYDSEQVQQIIGAGPGVEAIGDALVFLRGLHGIVDSRAQAASSIRLVGVHGSLTSDEMLVPVTVLA